MEESVSGFKERGSWGDVVEHGERITRSLRDLARDGQDVDEEALTEWDEWRPKQHERLDEDVNEKTAEQAAVNEGPGEKEGQDPGDDLKTAGEKLTESYEKLEDDDADGAVDQWGESVEHLARAADSAGRRALRKVEGTVYKNVMTQLAPYYFDNGLVSANVQRLDTDDYALEVNVNDDDLKIRVSNLLADYEQSVERWHVDTEKVTQVAEAVEGVESPPHEEEGDVGDTEGRSDPTGN